MFTVLVIDDERIFPNLDDGLGNKATVFYARTSQEAIEALSARDYDEVWFDHDLGDGDDAMKVVRWMEDQHLGPAPGVWNRRVGRFYVHTMNPVGATNLRSRLRDFGVPSFRVTLPTGHTTIHA